MKATITAAVAELFFKTQEMVDNFLKIEYFHLKTLLSIHYLCTTERVAYFRWNEKKKISHKAGPEDSGLPSVSPALLRRLLEWAPGVSGCHIYKFEDSI